MSATSHDILAVFPRLCAALELLGPSTARLGRRPALDAGCFGVELDEAGQPISPLVQATRALLYQYAYAKPFDPEASDASAATLEPDPGFLSTLIGANAGRERWDGGWTIAAVEADGGVWLRKGDRSYRARPGEYATHQGPGLAASVGAFASVRALPQSWAMQPGYYHAIGETLGSQDELGELVRLYFAVEPDGAATLVELITTRLNRYKIPFRAKWPTSPALYQRTDAAVLYVARRDFALAARLLADLPTRAPALLAAAVPLFCKRLAPGIGLAEEPGTGESFGMHRCRLLAEALVAARRTGIRDTEQTLARVRTHFAAHGLDLDHPWLNPGSRDHYALPGAGAPQ